MKASKKNERIVLAVVAASVIILLGIAIGFITGGGAAKTDLPYGAGVGGTTAADTNATGDAPVVTAEGLDLTNNLAGKSILFCGDSITEAICERYDAVTAETQGWPGRVGTYNNMDWVNNGVSGATISLENNWNPAATAIGSRNIIYNQMFRTTRTDFDFVILHGGTNDAWSGSPVGKMTAENNFDRSTFNVRTYAGGLEYCFSTAKERYPNAKLGFIINFRMPSRYEERTYDMREYFEEAKKICDKWKIPYLDLYFNTEISRRLDANTAYALGDLCHPNNRGYDIIYPYVKQFVIALDNGANLQTVRKLTDPEQEYLTYTPCNTTITGDDVNIAFGKTAYYGGSANSKIADGDYSSGNDFASISSGTAVVKLDLGAVYDINKIRVTCNTGNVAYKWEAYASLDGIDDLTECEKIAEKNDYDMEYPTGYLTAFDTTSARYVYIKGTYAHGNADTFHLNELEVFGTVNENLTFGGEQLVRLNAVSAITPTGKNAAAIIDGDTEESFVVDYIEDSIITIDLKSVREISRIVVKLLYTDSEYALLGSTDGVNWTKIDKKYSSENTSSKRHTVNASYRYIKMRWDGHTRGVPVAGINEISIYDGNGNKISPSTATVTENNCYWGNNAFDGIDDDLFNFALLYPSTDGVVIDLGREASVRKLTCFLGGKEYECGFYTSLDNKNWTAFGACASIQKYDPSVGISMYGNSAARYIKICPQYYTPDDKFLINELEIYCEQITLINASASSSGSRLTDGDKTTSAADFSLPEDGFIIFDLGVEYSLSKIDCTTRDDASVRKYRVQGSNDKEFWTLIGNSADVASGDPLFRSFAVGGNSFRYIKLVRVALQDNTYDVQPSYIQFFMSDGTEITDVNIDSYNSYTTYQFDCLNPNLNTYSHLQANPVASDCAAIIDLGYVVTVTEVALYVVDPALTYEVYLSNDGSIWTKFGSTTGNAVVTGSGNAKYVKVSPTNYIDDVSSLCEIEIAYS